MSLRHYRLFTDGACRPKYGIIAYAGIFMWKTEILEKNFGGVFCRKNECTVRCAEFAAICSGVRMAYMHLRRIGEDTRKCFLTILADNTEVVNSMKRFALPNTERKARNFVSDAVRDMEQNRRLILSTFGFLDAFGGFRFMWWKGHQNNDNPHNMCDAMCAEKADFMQREAINIYSREEYRQWQFPEKTLFDWKRRGFLPNTAHSRRTDSPVRV
nr:MAG TPA: Ribonuclease HI [Caudoviricetes sp.]